MDVSVFLHVGFLMEPLPAVLTRIRSRVRVNQQVSRERRRPFERLSTLFALNITYFFLVYLKKRVWSRKSPTWNDRAA